ncbi:hypothetical protein, partial [Bradyrhizobium sp. JR19.8]|uniref:hypothetical protein n=1 Tax=Bradyrhizobium sp. JR19.8 TaxID=3156370 RepID=UPI003392A661
ICSSVNLARFICPSFRRPDSNFNWRKSAGAGQRHLKAAKCAKGDAARRLTTLAGYLDAPKRKHWRPGTNVDHGRL